MCKDCKQAGCHSKGDGDGGWVRSPECPLMLAGGPDAVVMCLQCNKPLHKSESLTYVDNGNPGRGGCHTRCVDAYHAAKKERP